MSSSTAQSFRIEALTKDNYDTWCIQAEALLIKSDAWGYVNGTKQRPIPAEGDLSAQAAATAWDNADQKAKSDLILSISPSELTQIRGCKTSSEVWQKLRETYASKGPARKAVLLKQLMLHRMTEGEDIRQHLTTFVDIVDKLGSMSIDIHKDLLSIMLLYSLPPQYNNFRCAIESRDELPNIEILRVKILEETEARRWSKEEEHGAMAAEQPGRRNWKDKTEQKNSPRPFKPAFKYRCNKCRKIGHKASECRTKLYTERKEHNAGRIDETFYAEYREPKMAFEIENGQTENLWCLDSGCTVHVCKDKDKFNTLMNVGDERLKLASNSSTAISGKGNIRFRTDEGGKTKNIELNNALYVPDLRNNLMSVARITDRGNKVIFSRDKAEVKDEKGNTRLIARRIGDLYYVPDKQEYAGFITRQVNDLNTWHMRLGHLNHRDLIDMVKKEMVTGIELSDPVEMPICEVCIRGKQTSTPFQSRKENCSELLELVHSDLCGPMRVKSHGGRRYMVTFTDDHSRWGEVFFLKEKRNVLDIFKEYKSAVERQTGKKIKALQTDNGGEYCNAVFTQYLKNEGICHRKTVPHTPQQNGLAERRNRTLMDMARCMLIQSNLSHQFWAEAVYTANYLRNRIRTSSVPKRTPFEIWTGDRPDLSHLHAFGSKIFILDKSPNKGKLDARSKEGIFLGYSETSKGYRVWSIDQRKVVISRDIRVIGGMSEKCNDQSKDSLREIAPRTIELEYTLEDKTNSGDEESISLDYATPVSHVNQPEGDVAPLRRAPGRPRIERTGRRGRPKKLYNTVNNQENNEPVAVINDMESEAENNMTNIDSELAEANLITMVTHTENTTLDEAMNSEDREEWMTAIVVEIKNMLRNNVWDIAERPNNKKIIGCRTVLTIKNTDVENKTMKKARIVAKGCAQRPGIDFVDTFAPVARLDSFRLLMALSVQFNWKISQLDVTCAYLHGELNEETYMEKPPMLKEALIRIEHTETDPSMRKQAKLMLKDLEGEEKKVCKLRKALYGLRQSGRQWNECLNRKIMELGLRPTHGDPCLYHAKRGEEILLLLLYVDDMLIASSNKRWIEETKTELSKSFEIKDLGKAKYCLGIEIAYTHEGVAISQEKYINAVLQKFGMENCNPVSTPMDKDVNLKVVKETEDKNPKVPYRELIGALTYLAMATRPDIAHAVSVLAQFNERNDNTHWGAAKRILRYLKGTVNMCISYRKDNRGICGYVDADWARCSIDRRSYTGYVFTLNGGGISWKSQKQRTVALSSTEAEYMALSEVMKCALYLEGIVAELKLDCLPKIVIYIDNLGAKLLAENPIVQPRTKHIDIRHHFIRETVRNNRFTLTHVPTEEMAADILTKPLPKIKHQFCVSEIGIIAKPL